MQDRCLRLRGRGRRGLMGGSYEMDGVRNEKRGAGGRPASRFSFFWFFVDWVAGEPSKGAPTLFGPSPGGSPEAGGALCRFGLDIGRGTSGWADGADAVRGHENFFEGSPMPIPIVRLR